MLKYLYVRHPPLGWDPTMYGYFSGFDTALSGLCLLLALPLLTKVAKVKDTVLILAASVSNMAANVMMGLSTTTWMVFMGEHWIATHCLYCQLRFL